VWRSETFSQFIHTHRNLFCMKDQVTLKAKGLSFGFRQEESWYSWWRGESIPHTYTYTGRPRLRDGLCFLPTADIYFPYLNIKLVCVCKYGPRSMNKQGTNEGDVYPDILNPHSTEQELWKCIFEVMRKAYLVCGLVEREMGFWKVKVLLKVKWDLRDRLVLVGG